MAPKKKKKSGKKGKLAKMTEEERILYMEQKALAEEEMRKKKEDMLNQFLKVMYALFTVIYYWNIHYNLHSNVSRQWLCIHMFNCLCLHFVLVQHVYHLYFTPR